MYSDTSFHDCIANISQAEILPIFCDKHRDHHIPYLIREYVGVRYHFESKRLKNRLLSKNKAATKTNSKMSKMNQE